MVKFRDIQILRGISVLIVVLFHFNNNLFKSGFIGVDIFFVISGFIITYKIVSEKKKILEFYKKRVTRLIPALLFNIALFSTIFYFTSPKRFVEIYVKEGLFSLLNINNLYLYKNNSDYFQDLGIKSPFEHLWSLGIEEQFYLIWPIIIIILYKLNTKYKILFLLALSFTSLTIYILSTNPNDYFNPLLRFWELLFGAILYFLKYQLYSSSKDIKIELERVIKTLTYVIIITISYIELEKKASQVIAVLATSVILVIFTNKESSDKKINRIIKSILSKFGNMSYSIYLSHYMVYILMLNLLGVEKLNIGLIPITFILTLIISFLSYKIENRFNKIIYLRKILLLWLSLTLSLILIALPNLIKSEKSEVKKIENINLLQEIISNDENKNYSNVNIEPTLNKLSLEKLIFPSTHKCPNGVYACSEIKEENLDIILYGDSHAQMWWPSIYKLGDEGYNTYLIFKGGCPPSPLYEKNVRPGDSETLKNVPECNKFYKEALINIKKINPDYLLITGSNSTADWVLNLKETIKELKEIKERIIYIKDFFYPREDILNCYYDKIESENCKTNRISQDLHLENAKVIEEKVIREEMIKYIDVIDLQCNDKICPGILNNTYVYQDKSHLSVTYVESISRLFNEKILKAIKS